MTSTRRAPGSSKAVTAFIAAKFEFDALINRLADLSDDHFDVSPDGVTWGHVAVLNDYTAKLRSITDAAFREGEYAE